MKTDKPNVLFLMTDQQRFDTIRSLGNTSIHTPNLDRLVKRGLTFNNAYSTCPVCVPARYTIRTGCEPGRTRSFKNSVAAPSGEQPDSVEGRCGEYLARAMKRRGYHTFGIGKFHTIPWNEDVGYDVYEQSFEILSSPEHREVDAYASWLDRNYPEFSYLEALMGERTEMYYVPQRSPLPAELTMESWATDRAVAQIEAGDDKPWFGFVSMIGPHPPFAPPIPFCRMYDPDRMPDPVGGSIELDHMDEQIPWMNHLIWAEDINNPLARILKARYYGEISYIDHCFGRILDAVEATGKADNTVICFFSDHGDMLGDHHAWQKECFFEASCHVPLFVSWPGKLPRGESSNELVCLTDLFGIATSAAGDCEAREGIDVLGMLNGKTRPREFLTGMHEIPGTRHFKIMIRDREWKYIFMANGNQEQLFHMIDDPAETHNMASSMPELLRTYRNLAASRCSGPGIEAALEGGRLKSFPFEARESGRIYQFDRSRCGPGFPEKPEDALVDWPPFNSGWHGV